jgi:hypothetical protein
MTEKTRNELQPVKLDRAPRSSTFQKQDRPLASTLNSSPIKIPLIARKPIGRNVAVHVVRQDPIEEVRRVPPFARFGEPVTPTTKERLEPSTQPTSDIEKIEGYPKGLPNREAGEATKDMRRALVKGLQRSAVMPLVIPPKRG